MNIPIELKSDEKGYLDRECPNEECLYKFKVHIEDWKNKVSNDEVHCPMCGNTDTSDKWWTQEQLEDIQKIIKSYAISYIQEELGNGLKSLERSSNKYVKIKYNPGKKVTFINNPIGQSEEWNLDIKCQKCETRYSVIGSAYFCPHCGFNSVEKVLDESLDTISKMLNSVSEMKLMFSDMYGKDKAETMSRSMIEGAIGDIVSAFQKFAEMRFKTLSDKNVRVNDFQMVEKGSNLYREVISYGYEKWLNEEELDKMNLYFQRRHILEHNNGIIDQKYIEKSNDTTYKIGQRVIIKIEDVYELLDIIKKLTNGLKKI